MENQDLRMGWDDEIQEDGQDFLVLEEGDYNFTVTNMERSMSSGSGKIPASNMAKLTLSVEAGDGKTASCNTNIILYRTLEWKISQFFRSIGQKKDGEKVRMDWGKVIGSVGRAHFKPRTYKNKNGEDRQTNEVDYFIDYDEKLTPKPKEPDFMPVSDTEEALPFD